MIQMGWIGSSVCSDGHDAISLKKVLFFDDGMSAELAAQRRHQFLSESAFGALVRTRSETREQRHRDYRRRDFLVDRVLHHPAALAGINDESLDVFEARVALQSVSGQLQQPRSHHAALPPQTRDLGE